jgi:hypothetical protein
MGPDMPLYPRCLGKHTKAAELWLSNSQHVSGSRDQLQFYIKIWAAILLLFIGPLLLSSPSHGTQTHSSFGKPPAFVLGSCPIDSASLLSRFWNLLILFGGQVEVDRPNGHRCHCYLCGHLKTLVLARSTFNSRSACCRPHDVMLSAETLEIRKVLLAISVAKPSQKGESIFKIHAVFIL